MAAPDLFTRNEIAFLENLVDEEVEFLVVGLAAAALQGAPAVTQDIDLWFGHLGDEAMLRALKKSGVRYIPPGPSNPPLLAGGGADLFDIVTRMHGLGSFQDEAAGAASVEIETVTVPVLPLARIIASKEATDRPKDRAILPALRDALRVIDEADR